MNGKYSLSRLAKENVLLLLEYVQDINEDDESSDLLYLTLYFSNMKEEQIINHLVSYILPWKDSIIKKDMSFFLKNEKIFGDLPPDKVKQYRNILISDLDEKQREVLWKFFITLATLAEEYKKKI